MIFMITSNKDWSELDQLIMEKKGKAMDKNRSRQGFDESIYFYQPKNAKKDYMDLDEYMSGSNRGSSVEMYINMSKKIN